MATAKSGRQLSLSTASTAGYKRFSKCVLIAADRKSTRLNSSHSQISYAVFCLKKKKETVRHNQHCGSGSDQPATPLGGRPPQQRNVESNAIREPHAPRPPTS